MDTLISTNVFIYDIKNLEGAIIFVLDNSKLSEKSGSLGILKANNMAQISMKISLANKEEVSSRFNGKSTYCLSIVDRHFMKYAIHTDKKISQIM